MEFPLVTMHRQLLPYGIYQLDINLSGDQDVEKLTLKQVDNDHEQTITNKKSENGFSAEIEISKESLIKISGIDGLKIEGIVLTKK